MQGTSIFETVVPEFIGVENDEYRYKIKFQGFDTESRINLFSREYVLIITDEIAQHNGYQNAEEFLSSDEHLDTITAMKREREEYKGGFYSVFKVVCKSLSMINSDTIES